VQALVVGGWEERAYATVAEREGTEEALPRGGRASSVPSLSAIVACALSSQPHTKVGVLPLEQRMRD
jgi:hypothetical protein